MYILVYLVAVKGEGREGKRNYVFSFAWLEWYGGENEKVEGRAYVTTNFHFLFSIQFERKKRGGIVNFFFKITPIPLWRVGKLRIFLWKFLSLHLYIQTHVWRGVFVSLFFPFLSLPFPSVKPNIMLGMSKYDIFQNI